MILFRLHGLRVDGAARQPHGVGQILIVGVTLVMAEIETAVVAADAGFDVLDPILDQLGHPFTVRQKLSGHTHTVDETVGDRLRAHIRFHPSGTDHWDVHEFLDVGHILQITVLGHIHGRVSPVPGIVSTIVAVEHIVARVLQIPGCLFRFGHVPPGLHIGFARHRAYAEILDL